MLLTVPFALSIIGGRVDLRPDGGANYTGRPKLTEKANMNEALSKTGVIVTEAVKHGGIIMVITTIPYFLIQVPASIMTMRDDPTDAIAAGERWWSFLGLVICLLGLTVYMRMQLRISKAGEDRGKRMAVVKKKLKEGRVSLSGAVAAEVRAQEQLADAAASEYQSINSADPRFPTPAIMAYLKEILADAFHTYDSDRNGELDKPEVFVFFRDFHESISEEEMTSLFQKFDADSSGSISLDEFIGLAYMLIKSQDQKTDMDSSVRGTKQAIIESAFAETEEEEMPEEFTALPPDQQQAAIKKRAFVMLAIGTAMVVAFSDPMVDVMQEIAVRANLSPFYVSFILAPLASNASEVLSSQYYASKKTSKTITVSLTALEGAACMNNTFCLSIFMGLIFARGLAWQYSAETLAIVLVEFYMGFLVQKPTLSTRQAVGILLIFPLSIVLVAGLEFLGLD